jgi:Fe-S cluster assembly protein SufD
MTAVITRTEAEEQLARHFAAVAPRLPGGAWVPAARSRAIEAFGRLGLPHRRIEEWKYTDLRTGLRTAFPPASCAAGRLEEAALARALGPELQRLAAIRIVLVNGRYVSVATPPGHEADDGWHMGSLAAALGQPGYEWIEAHLGDEGAFAGDPVLALNTAFTSDGIVLRIAEGTRLAVPIHIVSLAATPEPAAIATRNLIRFEPGARAVVIESHVALAGAERQATAVTQLSVGAGAEAHLIQHIAAGAGSAHLGRIDVEVGRGATWRGFQLTAGAGLARNETRVGFAGPDARLDLSGLMLGRGADHIDTTLVVDHTTTGCLSRELFKAVLDDRARAVFQGKIIVAAEAQKTDGKQMAQALMLSGDAEFCSKPELEIYADDVACGHGSTAAEIDPAMLFYLRSRGLSEAEARAMLIESFAAEAIDRIEDEGVRAALGAVALEWLRRGP